jgi:hypothetical protein
MLRSTMPPANQIARLPISSFENPFLSRKVPTTEIARPYAIPSERIEA